VSALVTLSAPEAAGASVNSAGSQTSRDREGAAQDVLNRCRSESVHVRGCWVADLVLGKE
jgi:hypothetical protein